MQTASNSKTKQMDDQPMEVDPREIFIAWDKFIKELDQKGGCGYAIKNGTFASIRCLSFCDTCGEKDPNIDFTYYDMKFNSMSIHDAVKHNLVNPIQMQFLESKPVPILIPKTIPNPELS